MSKEGKGYWHGEGEEGQPVMATDADESTQTTRRNDEEIKLTGRYRFRSGWVGVAKGRGLTALRSAPSALPVLERVINNKIQQIGAHTGSNRHNKQEAKQMFASQRTTRRSGEGGGGEGNRAFSNGRAEVKEVNMFQHTNDTHAS